MMPYGNLSLMAMGLIITWILFIFWGYAFLEIYAIYIRQVWKIILVAIVMLPIYIIFQSMIYVISGEHLQWYTANVIAACPYLLILLVAVVLTISWGVLMRQSVIWRKNHITDISLWQSVDMLPEGICCYEANGRVRLKNHTMENLSWALTGSSLLNGKLFYEQVIHGTMAEPCYLTRLADKQVVVLGDGKAYSLVHRPIEGHKPEAFLLVAMDITEEYRNTQFLCSKQTELEELNRQLKQYNREIVSITAAREALNAKIRIHDELGSCLLTAKKYLLNGGTEEEKAAIMDTLQRNIRFMISGLEQTPSDEFELLLKTSKQLDVRVDVVGTLPEEKHVRHIMVTAMQECVTNTMRHAHGDRVSVKIETVAHGYQMQVTNNGIQPTAPIQETGGLESLRRMVEDAGGSMSIDISQGFLLSLTIGDSAG